MSVNEEQHKIIITQRSSDFHAHVEGHLGRWAAGVSPRAAVGDLVISHQDFFGIKIDDQVKYPLKW